MRKKEHFMSKVKRAIELNEKSLRILTKKQAEHREKTENSKQRLFSFYFENALILFYHSISERIEPIEGDIVKRQTIYLSKRSNAKFNELLFRYGYTRQELANIVIQKMYA